MRIELKYGSGAVAFEVPESNVAGVVRAEQPAPAFDAEAFLSDAVRDRLGEAEADCAGRNVLVLAADATRDQPHGAAYAALAPLLRLARSVTVLIATGTHKADTSDNRRIIGEVRRLSDSHGIPLESAEAHDCRTARFYTAGTTSRGNTVRLNARVAAADTIIVLSDTKPHYFAGYSNAIKFLLPAVAAFDSIERNHALALNPAATYCRHPLHGDPERRTNPVAEDQLEAARFVTAKKPVYALVTAGNGNAVNWATFGPLEPAVAEGIRFVDANLVTWIERPSRCAVISCGGYPNDETLYIAQRSLELTREAIADGGEILWLAECRNGIASSESAVRNFFTPLKADPAAYVAQIRKRYVMFAHKAVKFVELMARLKALDVVSALPAGTFPAAGMTACSEPGAVVAEWVARGERILFIDDANKLAVRVRQPASQG